MDLFIRNIEDLLKAAKSNNETMINLIANGAAICKRQGKLTADQFDCIVKVSECLLEDM